MKIADTIQDSIVDGPGLRFVVFTQGCDIRCVGCHNPDALDPEGGREISVLELISQLYENPLTDGLTLSGGEPFMQALDCSKIAKAAKDKGLNVWVFTGNTFEDLLFRGETEDCVMALLKLTDVLVDGKYMQAQRTLSMKWRGSKNQRFVDVPKSLDTKKVVLWQPMEYNQY